MSIDPLLPERPTAPATPAATAARLPYGRRRVAVTLGVCGLAAVVAFGFAVAQGDGGGDARANNAAPVTAAAPSTTAGPSTTIAAPATTTPAIDVPGSLWWLVNADHPIPTGYVPPDLVTPDVPLKPDTGATQLTAATTTAFEAMVAEAATAGFELQLTSGYRSYEQQQMLYDRFVQDYGQDVAAERVALPGTSEHQTGLAADVGLVGLPDDQLFGDTEASVWVADNAHRFGFILRYPPDKVNITGYANEPWHLRYVGVELAGELHASGLTMEEHFGLHPATAG